MQTKVVNLENTVSGIEISSSELYQEESQLILLQNSISLWDICRDKEALLKKLPTTTEERFKVLLDCLEISFSASSRASISGNYILQELKNTVEANINTPKFKEFAITNALKHIKEAQTPNDIRTGLITLSLIPINNQDDNHRLIVSTAKKYFDMLKTEVALCLLNIDLSVESFDALYKLTLQAQKNSLFFLEKLAKAKEKGAYKEMKEALELYNLQDQVIKKILSITSSQIEKNII